MTKENQKVYLSTAYLPPVEYFSKIMKYKYVVIEKYEHYLKQTYRNRCCIASPNGKQNLSIPIVKPEKGRNCAKDILISEHDNWQHTHWNAIEAAYNNTPFFEYYKDDFKPFFENMPKGLLEFNTELTKLICELLDIDVEISFTEEYKSDFSDNEYDFRNIISPKTDYKAVDKDFIAKPYYQVFEQKHGFIDNLSIIDLLFNMGPESVLYL